MANVILGRYPRASVPLLVAVRGAIEVNAQGLLISQQIPFERSGGKYPPLGLDSGVMAVKFEYSREWGIIATNMTRHCHLISHCSYCHSTINNKRCAGLVIGFIINNRATGKVQGETEAKVVGPCPSYQELRH